MTTREKFTTEVNLQLLCHNYLILRVLSLPIMSISYCHCRQSKAFAGHQQVTQFLRTSLLIIYTASLSGNVIIT